MSYELLPKTGIGPIRLGMPRDEVRALLGDPPEELARPEGVPMDFFVGARLQVEYGPDLRCRFIQCGPGKEVLLGGVRLMGQPFRAVRAVLEGLDGSTRVEGADLTSEALQVAVYAGSARKNPDTPVEAIAVFAPGYYGGSGAH